LWEKQRVYRLVLAKVMEVIFFFGAYDVKNVETFCVGFIEDAAWRNYPFLIEGFCGEISRR
tara:strand:- start:61 stop:243 length:183 start_codon:yes stop_codon:yes gene_type:complete